jgi:hypothetical protein
MLISGQQRYVLDLCETLRAEQIADNVLWRDADVGNSREADCRYFRRRLGGERFSATSAYSAERAETRSACDCGVRHEAASTLLGGHWKPPLNQFGVLFRPSALA